MRTTALVGPIVSVALFSVALSARQADVGVAQVRDAYLKASNAGDAKAIAALYTPDAVEMPPNEPMVKGRPAIESYYQKQMGQMSVKLALTAIETRTAGEWGYDVGTYTQTLTPKTGGGKPIEDRGKYVVLLKKGADGKWLVSHAIYNSDLPPHAMPPMK